MVSPDQPRVVVLGSTGATYEMFELEAASERQVRLRGPILLEVGEEIALQFVQGVQASTTRARIAAHDSSAGEPVTIAQLIDPSPDLLRLLAAS